MWAPGRRLHPWALYELELTARVVELRADDLTADERELIRGAALQMLRALDAGEHAPGEGCTQ
jgi:hypothetical protein